MYSFFRALWPDGFPADAAQTFFALPSGEAVHVPFAEFTKRTIPEVIEAGDDENLYFCLGATRLGIERGRGKEVDIVAMPGFAIDLDFYKTDATPEAFYELFEDMPPSATVLSGGGLHAYWILEKPLLITSEKERARAKNAYQAFGKARQKQAQKRGWKIDSTFSLDRVWRLPGSLNRKQKKPRPVETYDIEGPIYSLSDFGHSEKPSLKSKSKAAAGIAPVLARLKAVDEDDALYDEIQCVLAGESFGKRDRHNTLLKLTNKIAWFPESETLDPADLAELFRPLFVTWQTEKKPVPDRLSFDQEMKKAVGMFRTAKNKLEDKREKDRELFKGMTDDESDESLEEILQRLILCRSPSYFVYDLEKQHYIGPVARQDLFVQCRMSWDNDKADSMGVSVTSFNPKTGNETQKSAERLCGDYGEHIQRIVGDLSLNQSYYNHADKIFYQALCPRRDLAPKFDSEIDEFLRVFAGDSYEKLKDWLAAYPQLDKPLCVLYLEGETEVGKNVLAKAPSRIWRTQGPADFELSVTGQFNEQISRSPILWLDEGLTDRKNISPKVRSLIGGGTMVLNEKYKATVEIQGHVRLVVTANNPDALKFFDGNSKRDIDAIAKRILHIPVQSEASEWLRERGGREFVEPWFEKDLFARHVLWLEANHKFAPGSRLLVEGVQTDYHRNLRMQTEAESSLLEFLVRFLSNPKLVQNLADQGKDTGIFIKKGALYVSAAGVLDNWDLYMRDRQPPVNGQAVGHALNKISLEKKRIRMRGKETNLWYRCIDLEFLMSWMDKHGIGNTDLVHDVLGGEQIH